MSGNSQKRDDGAEAGTGKVLGMPYDWRRPTAERIRQRWWNPEERRVLTPKAWGWGFSFNFYEIARRLRLIRHD